MRHQSYVRVIIGSALLLVPILRASAQSISCTQSGPSTGAYTVTTCITAPIDGAAITGSTEVSATVTKSSGAPAVTRVVFYLGSEYVLTDYEAPYTFMLPSDKWVDGTRILGAQTRMSDGFVTQTATVTNTFLNGISVEPVNPNTFAPYTSDASATDPFVVVAAGDGADGKSRAVSVTNLIGSWNPDMFLYLGDVYERGSTAEFHNHYGQPDQLFGRFRSITNPTIGNHEYSLQGGRAYFQYWDNVPHYYSYEARGWKFISLDSTSEFGQTSPGTSQYEWLSNELTSNPAECTLAYFHHPRFSVGKYAAETRVTDIWSLLANSGVDIVLVGHDHNYQRWLPLDGTGTPSDDGTTQFVVGTAGRTPASFTTTDPRMVMGVYKSPDLYGALRLQLNPHGASYSFTNIAGATLDSGWRSCSGAPPDAQPPEAPENLVATPLNANEMELNWSAAADDVAVSAYRIYRDGQLLTTIGPETRFVDSSVSSGSVYTYQVAAEDGAGNLSTLTPPVQASTPSSIFADGFETGSMSAWTKVVGMTVQQTDVFSGSNSARASTTGTASYANKTLPTDQQDAFYSLRFKIVRKTTKNLYLI
ncbi:MAG: metallophosphoesterase, partial [Actinomycetota bacterium]|nr:metallophosphoesterase [Actinomycetota bacterium]